MLKCARAQRGRWASAIREPRHHHIYFCSLLSCPSLCLLLLYVLVCLTCLLACWLLLVGWLAVFCLHVVCFVVDVAAFFAFNLLVLHTYCIVVSLISSPVTSVPGFNVCNALGITIEKLGAH